MSIVAIIPVTPVYPTFCRIKYKRQKFKDRKKDKKKYQCRGKGEIDVSV